MKLPEHTPEHIILPTGEQVQTKQLINKVKNRVNYNLLTKSKRVVPETLKKGITVSKYSLEDRRWQANTTVEEIQQKYNLTYIQAQQIKYNAKHILKRIDPEYDNISNKKKRNSRNTL
jgi:hypothetical protein